MKGSIFISYRRDDAAGYAGRLYDRLVAQFGQARVFMDVEGIEPGADFVDAIERAVGSCEILIVIIGHDWLAKDPAGKRRLDEPADFVRLETATALKRGIRVVPVLVEGATIPRAEDLPADLAPLVRRQAVELNHKQWEATTGELIGTLERILGQGEAAPREAPRADASPLKEPPAQPAPRRFDRRYAAAAVVALAVAAALLFTRPWSDETPSALPVLYVTPGSVQFADQTIRAAGAPTAVKLENVGPGALHVKSVKIEGAQAPDFEVSDDRCSGRELEAGQSCSLNLIFKPQGEGARSAALAIAHDGRSVPPSIAVQGRGTAALVASAKPPASEPAVKTPAERAPVEKTPAEKAPVEKAPAEKARADVEAKPAPPKPVAPPAPPPERKPEVAAAPPRILNFESRLSERGVNLCYGVDNAASATITPFPGAVKPLMKECVSVPADASRTYVLTARNAAGALVSRSLDVEIRAKPPAAQVVTIPNLVGQSRRAALAELEKAGLESRVLEGKAEPFTSPAADSVVAQKPQAGDTLKAGGRVTLYVMPEGAPLAALSPKLPRVGDTWQYQSKSIWKNVEPKSYAHQVTAVSEREIRETMSVVGGGERASESKAFNPDARYVEWRGNGYYVVEFNPFLAAFDVLRPDSAWKSLATPAYDPFVSNWYSHGRVTGWESVTVPAGTFKALRVELNSSRQATASLAMRGAEPVRVLHVAWYAPDAKRTVKQVRTTWSATGGKLDEDTFELVRYKLQ